LRLRSRSRLQNHLGNPDGLAQPVAPQFQAIHGEAARQRSLNRRMDLRETALLHVRAPFRTALRFAFGGGRCVRDLAAGRAGSLQPRSQAAAYRAQRVQPGGDRDVVQFHGDMRLAAAGQVAGQSNAPVAQRRVANQVVDGVRR